jgi:ribosomal protein S18 acetylase RimI-like enzyme
MNDEVTNHFVHRSAAQRYAAARPYFHPMIIEKIAAFIGTSRVIAALDVACGTGQSARALAAQWSSDRARGYLAWDGDNACGIAAGFLDADAPSRAHLISMWVAPTHRKRGVGRMLIEAIADWARGCRAVELYLDVTSNNGAARAFYERLGFIATGKTKPYPNDPTLMEDEMMRPIERG